MLEKLEALPSDSILGLMAAYRADPSPQKIDVGVGVFRNDRGETPVPAAVREAEKRVLARQASKSYVAAAGNPGFNAALSELVLGAGHPAIGAGRVRTIQSVGGCGALRLGAELILRARPQAVVHVSDPTWANHVPLLSGCGLKLERYPYYDAQRGALRLDAMFAALRALPPRSVVLVHASCHNPTGADLETAHWDALLELCTRGELLPFIDIAYQGLGVGIEADAAGLRRLCAALPEALVAVSCSKNFGLYRERTGALILVGESATAADAAVTHLVRIARSLYSMPPDHGAAIVHEILTTPELAAQWRAELDGMRERIDGLRGQLVRELATLCPQRDFGFIRRQRGMFSCLGIGVARVRALREQHHIYMTDDSRMNIAGLDAATVPVFAAAVADVLQRMPETLPAAAGA